MIKSHKPDRFIAWYPNNIPDESIIMQFLDINDSIVSEYEIDMSKIKKAVENYDLGYGLFQFKKIWKCFIPLEVLVRRGFATRNI